MADEWWILILAFVSGVSVSRAVVNLVAYKDGLFVFFLFCGSVTGVIAVAIAGRWL